MLIAETIESRLREGLSPDQIEVKDESHFHAGHAGARPEGQTHFRVRIVASAFSGQPRVKRHRMVTTLLQDLMDNPIHALALTTLAPEDAQGKS